METFQNLAFGLSICLQPVNLVYCLLGVLMGTLVGVLPGLGPPAAISLLLPTIFHLNPISSLIMFSGICYGANYGGSTTSILVNMPGEAASVVTTLDGYQMAKKGRAGPALGMAAFGSFIAGTFGVIGLMFFAPTLANFALRFGPPEYFSLAVMSLTFITYVSRGSIIKCLMMACVGLIISIAGTDTITVKSRFTFGLQTLRDGVGLVYVAMGLFGMSEVLENLSKSIGKRGVVFSVSDTKIRDLFPNRKDWIDSAKPIGRGSLIGFFLGILPGFGAAIPTFISYAVERKFSKYPEKFGTGIIEGVAGPESANNAASQATFIPLLSLGIPANPSTAVILGALMILGLQPGPLFIGSRPDLFWGVVASMYLGNVLLLVLNLPLIGIWIQMLKIPYSILSVLIILFCQIGAYSNENNAYHVLIMNVFGVFGYLMRRYQYEGAPLILALVLGPMLERSLRRSLIFSDGSPAIFFSRPISAVFLSIAIVLLVSTVVTGKIRKKAIEMKED